MPDVCVICLVVHGDVGPVVASEMTWNLGMAEV